MPGNLTPARWRAQVKHNWEQSALGWECFEPQLMYSLAAVDPALIRALAVKPGQRLLDVGCGSGEPTLTLAKLVGPRGAVLGVDVSRPMLQVARRRARQHGVTNLRFVARDIARFEPGRARFDGATSRFGLMFVDDIAGALARIRSALKPGGRAAFAVWGPVERNPYFAARDGAIRPFLREPPPDPEHAPHPLRFARPGALARHLRQAGFKAVASAGVVTPLTYNSLDQVLAMTFGVPGPSRELYVTLSRADQRRLGQRLVGALRRFVVGPLIRAPGFAWVVSGRK